MLSTIFKQFVTESPITVMARGLMERVFAPERMDDLFETMRQTSTNKICSFRAR